MKKFICLLIGLISLLPNAQARLSRISREEVANRVDCKDDICLRIVKRHLIRDLKGCQIDPSYLPIAPRLAREAKIEEVLVHGRSAFLGAFPFPYSYQMNLTSEQGILITAKVYFTNQDSLSQNTLENMQDKLDAAAAKWSSYNPYPFPLKFKFLITHDKSKADVRTKLLVGRYTRGPYFSFWSTLWDSDIVSHEMGHVMGLDDEYSNTPFRSLTYCDRSSIMCTDDTPYPYHYYLIVRRMLCQL